MNMLQEIMNEKYLFSNPVFEDNRGFFEEVWNLKSSKLADFDGAIQVNRSFSKKANTAIFRGACHKTHRKCFVETNYRIPKTDIKDTRKLFSADPQPSLSRIDLGMPLRLVNW